MNTHGKLRGKIDEIDTEMIALFEARMEVAEEIAECKIAQGIPVFDGTREEEVICRNVNKLQDDALKEYADSFFKHLMALSRKKQQENFETSKISHEI
ncbi:chorismate mutase [Salinicoccus siamensis]|uniref:Chorismate mutase n=1 Tax=Salinicoccus siamensis TaxID=381830 RepID=A0ABV5Z335_9STAP